LIQELLLEQRWFVRRQAMRRRSVCFEVVLLGQTRFVRRYLLEQVLVLRRQLSEL
jgi:hypothetical protein